MYLIVTSNSYTNKSILMYLVSVCLGFLVSNKLTKKIVRNQQGLSWKLSKLTKQNTSDQWAFVVWLSWKLTRKLTIHEFSLSTVEIEFWLLNILYRRGKKKRIKGRRGRSDRERENDYFYFFKLVWGKKTKKKGLIICLFWINWSYFSMSLLYWGLILEVLSFDGKKNLGLI